MKASMRQLLGKHILASLSEIDNNGRVLRRQEFHGPLIEYRGKPALRHAGSKRPFVLPDELGYYRKADPDRDYALEESGETVSAVDYTLTFVKVPPEFANQPDDDRATA